MSLTVKKNETLVKLNFVLNANNGERFEREGGRGNPKEGRNSQYPRVSLQQPLEHLLSHSSRKVSQTRAEFLLSGYRPYPQSFFPLRPGGAE